jgi:hypothetical protein
MAGPAFSAITFSTEECHISDMFISFDVGLI